MNTGRGGQAHGQGTSTAVMELSYSKAVIVG